MSDALIAAVVVLVTVAVQAITVELRIRTARRERDELGRQVADVAHLAGADRRRSDPARPAGDADPAGPRVGRR